MEITRSLDIYFACVVKTTGTHFLYCVLYRIVLDDLDV